MEEIILANRIKYELKEIKNYPKFELSNDGQNPLIWIVSFEGEEKTLYENQKFTIKYEISRGYVSLKIF